MFSVTSVPVRDLTYTAVALAFCAAVLWVDLQTDADIVEAYLYPLAFIVVYPVKRDWSTFLVAAVGVAGTIYAALREVEGESVEAMFFNRGMTIVVIIGVAFLLNRVTASQRLLVRIATTDALTGIFNRRHFMAVLAREQHRADRYATSFSLLMLDIDHFKRINDTYGHPVGDEAIKAMATAASKFLRPTDMIGRFGGEEFVVMLPHTDEAGAVVAAERIRQSVADVVVSAGDQDVRFTVSIGAATYVRRAKLDQLLECADQALYAAKSGGRNQVCVGRLAASGGPSTVLAPA
jgi:diguanylate cyclase (GGDEF)-like protein